MCKMMNDFSMRFSNDYLQINLKLDIATFKPNFDFVTLNAAY